MPMTPDSNARARAQRFIIMLGTVSLFADMTYEGARSVNGPFLAVLGASGTVVGVVAGAGELLGYLIRFLSGRWSDRSRRYWRIVGVGYAINLVAVPALALAGGWPVAAGLMVTERVGKGIRTPARDVLLAGAAGEIGTGWGFGLHEALDQAGAVLGPLLLAAALTGATGYRPAFALLAIPATLALASLAAARRWAGAPVAADLRAAPPAPAGGFGRAYRLYLGAAGLVALGFADFPLIAYHLERAGVLAPPLIPLSYGLAMLGAAGAALGLGKVFDRIGLALLAPVTLVTALAAPLAFLGGAQAAVAGVVLWGMGMGAHESVMRAAVAEMVPAGRLGSAFGTFNAVFGTAWFAGSVTLGVLYDRTVTGLVALAVGAQLAAIPVLLAAARARRREAVEAAA
ncbi:MAG: MFS transporter [Gemmatimonadales bacterium]